MLKIGILGFGIVGKSALNFLQKFKKDPRLSPVFGCSDFSIFVWDERELSTEEFFLIESTESYFISGLTKSVQDLWLMCDKIIVSPGFDISYIKNASSKLICELDLFSRFFSKPVIAITGSFGKTTTTSLIGVALENISNLTSLSIGSYNFPSNNQLRVAVGGNIGFGMLDLVSSQENYDCTILELSSWQLEYSNYFVPDIAVWTNLFPNHLDRHKTMSSYSKSKYSLFAGQKKGNVSILSANIFDGDVGIELCEKFKKHDSSIILTSLEKISDSVLDELGKNIVATVVAYDGFVFLNRYDQKKLLSCEKIIEVDQLPSITFVQNLLQIIAMLYSCNADIKSIVSTVLALPSIKKNDLCTKHRVEYFATVLGADFYDDSKSTVVQTTQAAVEKLSAQKRQMIVILGGLNKGADRSCLVPFLRSFSCVKKIYTFGKAFDLKGDIYFETLEDVVDDIMKNINNLDIVLLSPSGSSFDLFKNYEHRGNLFKELVLNYSMKL